MSIVLLLSDIGMIDYSLYNRWIFNGHFIIIYIIDIFRGHVAPDCFNGFRKLSVLALYHIIVICLTSVMYCGFYWYLI